MRLQHLLCASFFAVSVQLPIASLCVQTPLTLPVAISFQLEHIFDSHLRPFSDRMLPRL